MDPTDPASKPAAAAEAADEAAETVVSAAPEQLEEPQEPEEPEAASGPEGSGGSPKCMEESKKARKKRLAREKRTLEFKAERSERQRVKRAKQSALSTGERGGSGEGGAPFGGKTDHPERDPMDEEGREKVRAERTARKAAEVEDFKSRCNEGTTVVLDLEWEDVMHRSEVKSLVQQLLYCYGANRKAEKPVRLVLSGVRQGSETRAGLAKQAGYDGWPITVVEGNYIDIYDRERLVYLTADSEEVVETFDPDKVYVIGGIVDRNRLKGVTSLKAEEQKIATAALPLTKYVDMGTYSRVLTVNHVLQIVLEHQRCGDWREAIDKGIPGRKKFTDDEAAVASTAQDAGVGASDGSAAARTEGSVQ